MPTEDPADRAARLIQALDRRAIAAHRHHRLVSRELGVRDDELVVLLHIAGGDGATQAELGDIVGLSRSGMGAMIQRLERADMVERHPDPDDRRIRRVRLTPATRERITAAFAPLTNKVAHLLDELSSTEQRALERLLAAVADVDVPGAPVHAHGEPVTAPPAWRLWG